MVGLLKILLVVFIVYITFILLKTFFRLTFLAGRKTGEMNKKYQVKEDDKPGKNGKVIELDKDQYKIK